MKFQKISIFRMACMVFGCPNSNAITADPNIHYFGFPKKPSLAQEWRAACLVQEPHVRISNAKICSIHFDDHSYMYTLQNINNLTCLVKVLKKDAIPTINMPTVVQFTVVTEQEKYKHIKTQQDLKQLQTLNENLKETITSTELNIHSSNIVLSEYMDKYKEASVILSDLRRKYRRLRQPAKPKTHRKYCTARERALLSKVFSESQIRILQGRTKCWWTHDDMAVAYTIRHLSSRKFYHYLTQKLKIPLPGLSSIDRWALAKKKAPSVKNEDENV